jgi:chemotaxis protein MotB
MARKKKPEEHVNHERWLVSYADFITLLFAFFTTLYAISTVDKTKAGKLVYSMRTAFNVEIFASPEEQLAYQGVGAPAVTLDGPPGIGSEGGEKSHAGDPNSEEDEESFGSLAKDLKGMVDDPKLKGKVSVKMEDRGMVISLAEAGFFDSGKAGMDAEAKAALDKIVTRLTKEKFGLIVEGHTDNKPVRGGTFHSNWELSTARATSVVQYAVEQHKISPSRMSAAGYGEYRPTADNTTDDGRKKNRRVDIVVLYKQGAASGGSALGGARPPSGTVPSTPEPASKSPTAPEASPPSPPSGSPTPSRESDETP